MKPGGPEREINPLVAEFQVLAAGLESRGAYQAAAQIYRNAIMVAGTDDPILVGMLHINVGNMELAAGLPDKAIASYQRAAEFLEAQKGEAILQRGYAFLNMARQLLLKDDPKAVAIAAKSLKIFRAYPYTTARDIADAVALHFLARLYIEKKSGDADLRAAWREVKVAPCAELIEDTILNFILNYLLIMKRIYPHEYAAARAEVEEWALPDLFAEAVALVEGGPK